MRKYQLKGNLKIGQHSNITCDVQMQVDQIMDDEWAEEVPDYDPNDYIDGVRATGELSFDSIPLNDLSHSHPVRLNAIGEIIVWRPSDDLSSKLNILIGQRNAAVDVVKTKIKRYFWSFCVVGKPKWDSLFLFPENYRGVNMNRVYTCTNFRGKYWPVEVSSVVIAADRREAKRLLDAKLREAKIPYEGMYDLVEHSLETKAAVLLNMGNE